MACDFEVCIIETQDKLKEIKEILLDYEYNSDEIKELINSSEEAEYQVPTSIYTDLIEVTENAIWFDARNCCGDKWFSWLARKINTTLLYATWNDCGDGNFHISITHENGETQYIKSIDALKHYEKPDEKELYEKEFIQAAK